MCGFLIVAGGYVTVDVAVFGGVVIAVAVTVDADVVGDVTCFHDVCVSNVAAVVAGVGVVDIAGVRGGVVVGY